MFRPVSPEFKLILCEEQILNFWKLHRIFAKTSEKKEGAAEFVLYESPPSAHDKPNLYHALARAYKDVFLRYKLMRGYHVTRRSGWDTHGLPVEIGVERQLGINHKSQIEDYGIAPFNERCRESVFGFIKEWERFSDRIAFWVDMEEAYVTFTREYIESVWWIIKTFWDQGLVYQGYNVVPYCPRCGTPLSQHEVAQGYRDVVDESVYVRLPLAEESGTSLVVWTSAPWTLPGNVAVAVHPELDYITVERRLAEGGKERLILAQSQRNRVFGNEYVRVVETYKGKKLKGVRYKPLFTFIIPDKPAHFVVLQESVKTEEGSGLVHIAPAFSERSMLAAIEFDLPILMTVTEEGEFIPEIRPWSGRFVKEADRFIVQDLEARGLLLKSESYTHTHPFCRHCETPLLYYACNTWFLRTRPFQERLLALNQSINWIPQHIGDEVFGKWLKKDVDWVLGRERFWGVPLPIWECETCRHQLAIGSLAELAKLAGRDLTQLDLHRPVIDQVTFPCPECNARQAKHKDASRPSAKMKRVAEVMDGGFDTGAMPVAQWHYPFENREGFRRHFPADLVCEGVDQTRGWFYGMHAISALLLESAAFKNAICLGQVLDDKGRKMSTSQGNMVDPWEVVNRFGADALRWCFFTTLPPGRDGRFSADRVGEMVRSFTLRLWNVYAFFVSHASLERWLSASHLDAKRSDNNLDRWLRSELHALVRDVTIALENYDITQAARSVQGFVGELSGWYLRRSRRRFGKNTNDVDKQSAYATLYEALVTLSKLLAPSMPFLAEELYQNLVRSVDGNAPESVHLCPWPLFDPLAIDESLRRDMCLIRKLARLGHAARQRAGIPVHQALAEATFGLRWQEEVAVLEKYAYLLAEELNVKQVRPLDPISEAVSYTIQPLPGQLGQKYKGLYSQIAKAIGEMEAQAAARRFLAGQPVRITMEGEVFDILPEEVEVRVRAPTNMKIASEGAYWVALKTGLSPELRHEGLAREMVRRVQGLRKQAELDIGDPIRLYVRASPRLTKVFRAQRETIMGETRASEWIEANPPEGVFSRFADFDGEKVHLGIQRT